MEVNPWLEMYRPKLNIEKPDIHECVNALKVDKEMTLISYNP